MATIAHTLDNVFRRPKSYTGWWSWVTTVDHKRIAVLYGVTTLILLLIGGIEALIMRLQLARPNNNLVSPELFNQLLTMHGTTMIFMALMPLSATFFNAVIPLMIGARDVAFPRLNALSYWIFLFGSILINLGWFFGGAPNAGWFGYANLTTRPFNMGPGIDFWAVGLSVLGVSTMASAFNFFVTIVNMRAPGLSLFRMPLFVWMTLVTSFIIIFAFPVITVALFELIFDRYFGTNFFNTAAGGDPLLWQHLFWTFGHPEVYILILPAMGIVSEVLPTFSRKPLFGYPIVVLSGIAIAFMSWGVWAHHMFTVGLGPVANAVFGITTMAIAIPTGVKIFNWIGTLWGGSIDLKTPMLFALGFIAMFIIGGLSGVTHAVVPSDFQQQDTYYIVAHFHYVLFGGSLFGLLAGFYYWFPKIFGRLMDEGLGKWHFWITFIGFNLTFAPMHILGLNGMPRRIYTYSPEMGWNFWNLVQTIGVFIIFLGFLIFAYNIVRSLRRGDPAGNDPWDGRTLEWSIPSPPPVYNFAVIPTVHSRDPYWHQKYAETPDGRVVRVPAGSAGHEHAAHAAHDEGHGIHVPQPSFYPFLAALGLGLLGAGFLFHFALGIIGVIIMLYGIYGWALEPTAE